MRFRIGQIVRVKSLELLTPISLEDAFYMKRFAGVVSRIVNIDSTSKWPYKLVDYNIYYGRSWGSFKRTELEVLPPEEAYLWKLRLPKE